MKKATYKKIGEREETYKIIVPAEYDEDGNILSEEHEETRTRIVPIMGTVYEEMTEEEILSLETEVSDKPTQETEANTEERIDKLEKGFNAIKNLLEGFGIKTLDK